MNIKEIINKYNITDIQVSSNSYLPMTQTLVRNKKVSALFPAYEEFTLWDDIIKPGCFRDTTRTAIVVYETASGGLRIQSRKSAVKTYALLCQEPMLSWFCYRSPDYSAEVARMLTPGAQYTSPGYGEYGVAIKKVTSMSDVLNFATYTHDLHLFLYTLDGGPVYSGPRQGVQRLTDMDKHKALISIILKPYNDGYKWTYVLMLVEDRYDFCDIKNRLEKWIPDMPSFSPSIPVFAPQR